MVEIAELDKKMLTYERLLLSLRADKVQLFTSVGLYLGLLLILYFENGVKVAILGTMIPLAVGLNCLLLMDAKDIFWNFHSRMLANSTLVGLVLIVNSIIVWFTLPNWQLSLIPWLIPLVIKFGIDTYIKFKS